jgi:hypothetical protein
MKDTDTPEDDETMREWFRRQLDPAVAHAPPFDRERWTRDTLPRLRGDRRPGDPGRRRHRLLMDVAAAAAAVLIAVGLLPSAWTSAGLHALGVGAPAPLAAAPQHAAVMAEFFWAVSALPPHGTAVPEPIRKMAGLAMSAATPAPVVTVAMLRHSRVVPVNTPACPTGPGVRRLDITGRGRTFTIIAYQGKCPWFYVTARPLPRRLRPRAYRVAMADHRLYYLPAKARKVLAHQG